MEFCKKGCIYDVIEKVAELSELQVIKIIRDVTEGLNQIHSNKIAHRDIKLENILLGEDNNYKICDFGSITDKFIKDVSSLNRDDIWEEIEQNTTPLYRAPEQLDLYSNFPIDQKVDIFALGIVLFILCFKKIPFESKLAAIQNQYFIPDKHKFSNKLINLLKMMFEINPINRPDTAQILDYIDYEYKELKDSVIGVINPDIFNQGKVKVKPTLFDKCKKFMSRLTTKSKGWLISALEENEMGPKQKYVRLLIVKSWQKRYKPEKIYNILYDHVGEHKENTIISIKSLLFIHSYFKKGPPECIIATHYKNPPSKIIQKIIRAWTKILEKNVSKKQDSKRNEFNSQMIVQYGNILNLKNSISLQHQDFFEGNYSLNPFFLNIENGNTKNNRLSPELFEQLFGYLEKLLQFQELVLSQYSIWNIQCNILLNLADEEYCLLCLITHLMYAFKQSTNYYSEELDQFKIKEFVLKFEKKYSESFIAIHKFLLRLSSLKDEKNMYLKEAVPKLDLQVIEFIKNVEILKNYKKEFNILQFLNLKNNIYGIKIPLSYGVVVKPIYQNVEHLNIQNEEDANQNRKHTCPPINQNQKLSKFPTDYFEQSEPLSNDKQQIKSSDFQIQKQNLIQDTLQTLQIERATLPQKSQKNQENLNVQYDWPQHDWFEALNSKASKQQQSDNSKSSNNKQSEQSSDTNLQDQVQVQFDNLWKNDQSTEDNNPCWEFTHQSVNKDFFVNQQNQEENLLDMSIINIEKLSQKQKPSMMKQRSISNNLNENRQIILYPDVFTQRISPNQDKQTQNQLQIIQNQNIQQNQDQFYNNNIIQKQIVQEQYNYHQNLYEDPQSHQQQQIYLQNSQQHIIIINQQQNQQQSPQQNQQALQILTQHNHQQKHNANYKQDIRVCEDQQNIFKQVKSMYIQNLDELKSIKFDDEQNNKQQNEKQQQSPNQNNQNQVQQKPKTNIFDDKEFDLIKDLKQDVLQKQDKQMDFQILGLLTEIKSPSTPKGNIQPRQNQNKAFQRKFTVKKSELQNLKNKIPSNSPKKDHNEQLIQHELHRFSSSSSNGDFNDIRNKQDVIQSPKKQKRINKQQNASIDIKQMLQNEVDINADDWIINIKDVQIEQQIGSGNSCTVYKGYWKGMQVAIKKMKLQNIKTNHYKEFQREISTLVKIQSHKNLVQLLGIAQVDDEFYIIMEFCGGGTLFDILHRQKSLNLTWNQRLKICKDIAEGMAYLHSQTPSPIIHRDLKSLNLLLDKNMKDIQNIEDINVKIADFGLSRVNDTELMTGVLGTFHWMAPEIFESKPYSIKADVYSFGIVLWEICSRQTPYKELQNPHAIMKYVTLDKGRPDVSKIAVDCPQLFKDLMSICWDHDPSKRPDFEMIREIFNVIK